LYPPVIVLFKMLDPEPMRLTPDHRFGSNLISLFSTVALVAMTIFAACQAMI
jgi:hypothetical protein